MDFGRGGALCTCTDHSSLDTTICKARFSRCMDRISPTVPQTRQRQCSLSFYYEENGGFNLGVMKHWMRKNNPELFDHIEQWFKADKKRKKEVPDRWAVMLDAVEDFYNTHTSNEQQ